MNGLESPAAKKKITITIYVRIKITPFLSQLVSHALSASTRLLRCLRRLISFSKFFNETINDKEGYYYKKISVAAPINIKRDDYLP